MKSIYKYPLTHPGLNQVKMFEGAQILHIGYQAGRPCAWAFVDTTKPSAIRDLWVFGTGWEMSDLPEANPPKYLGTAHTEDSLVWHVFESSVSGGCSTDGK